MVAGKIASRGRVVTQSTAYCEEKHRGFILQDQDYYAMSSDCCTFGPLDLLLRLFLAALGCAVR